MKTILDIANITFWEIIRDKILYGLIFVTLILLLVSTAMAQLSFAEQAKITMDFSLFALNISTVVISIFLGAQLFYREIENKSLLTLLTHPVSRMQFLLGKIVGLFYINLILALIFTLIIFIQAWYYQYPHKDLLLYPMLGILLESLIILSLTICLSTFLKVSLSVSITFFVYLIGHFIENIKFFAERIDGQFLNYIYNTANVVVPNLELMNWKGILTTKASVDPVFLLKVIVYTMMWCLIFNLISLFTFSNKDIT